MIELQMLINKWKQEADLLKQGHKEMFNPYHPLTAEHKRLRKCIGEAELLLLNDESKQPQPPISQTPMLGELPPVVNDGTEENSQAVEGATPVVRQNEQTKKNFYCHNKEKNITNSKCNSQCERCVAIKI